jgi:hypothetical protein
MRGDRREPGSAEDDRGRWTGNERELLISAATPPFRGLRAAKTPVTGYPTEKYARKRAPVAVRVVHARSRTLIHQNGRVDPDSGRCTPKKG